MPSTPQKETDVYSVFQLY